MAAELLLDTGPLVALLDADQRDHARCVEFFDGWRGPIVTTEAVITEATHLLASDTRGVATCLEFFVTGGATVINGGLGRLERVLALVRRYADLPMDYADGTLVALAEELRAADVFTLDRRGFLTYRWGHRRTFRVHP